MPGVEVYIGNAIDVVPELAKRHGRTFNSVVTSPPYLRKRSYLPDCHPDKHLEIGQEETIDEFVAKLCDLFDAIWQHLLRDDGSIWVNIADGYAGSGGPGGDYNDGGLKDGQPRWEPYRGDDIPEKSLMGVPERFIIEMIRRGWRLRNKVIWFKGNEPDDGDEAPPSNGMPDSAQDRLKQTWEYLYHFSRERKYFYALDEIRERHSPESIARTERGRNPGHKWENGPGDQTITNDMSKACHPLGRNPGDMWFIPTKGFSLAHYATYNPTLVHRPAKATCPVAVCKKCGAPVILKTRVEYENPGNRTTNGPRSTERRHEAPGFKVRLEKKVYGEGYEPTCDCKAGFTGGKVLDPFGGSGSTAQGVFEAVPSMGIEGDFCQPTTVLIDLDERNLSITEKRLTGQAKASKRVDMAKYGGGLLAALDAATGTPTTGEREG